jgi:hypothetical protein
MTPLRRFALAITPFFILGACSELIGLSDFEKGDAPEGDGGEESTGGKGATGGKGGTSGSQSGGSSGSGRGGTGTGGRGGTGNTGPGGESGDGGMGGEPEGGTGGMPGGKGGTAGRGGTSGAGMGGISGAGAGSGGAGTAGGGIGGMGGSGGGSCTTVTVPLRSPGFDSDTGAWIQYDDGTGPPRPSIIETAASAGITAHSVPNVANLAGRDSISIEGHYQTLTIPAGAVTITLSGYRQVRTEESVTTVYDRVRVQMYEDAIAGTGYLGEFATFANTDAGTAWVSFTGQLAVGARAGQMMDLDMWAVTDSSLITDFYFDSLTLTALVCL